MKKHKNLSIITLTKNRAELLRKHLASIVGQTRPGDEIIIVNNNSTDHTKSVIDEFRDTLPIRSCVSHLRGFPKLYNLAISKATNPILVFFDDDCIAQPEYLSGHRNAHRVGKPRVIQGWSASIPKGNIYAEMTGDHYRNWITMYMTRNGKMCTFDNKNISFPKTLLAKYGTYFPKLAEGGEDIELGFRLSGYGIPIVFAPHIVVHHYERIRFGDFVRQHLRFARGDAQLARHMNEDAKLSKFIWYKIGLHAKSALRRELQYIASGNIRDAIRLPLLYCLLFFLRTWGHITSR